MERIGDVNALKEGLAHPEWTAGAAISEDLHSCHPESVCPNCSWLVVLVPESLVDPAVVGPAEIHARPHAEKA